MSAESRWRAVAAETGMNFEPDHEPSFWLRTQLVDLGARLRSGQLRGCRHLMLVDIGVVALWAREQVMCGHCADTLRLEGEADHTCDRCSRVERTMYAHVAEVHPQLLVTFGLCRSCNGREVAA